MARVRRKICTRQNGVLVCKEIEMETDVWGEGAFSSLNACVARARKLKKEGRSYAELIQQLNIQRVWRKNQDPERCELITQCMREVAKMYGRDPSRIRDICG